MKRLLVFLYGLASYALFFVTFLYTIGFVAGLDVLPKTVDDGAEGSTAAALLVNFALIALFGLQHTVMARPAFKQRVKRLLPQPVERSTYVLLSTLCWALLLWQWRPIPGTVWLLEGAAATAMWGVFAAGWLLLLSATFVIDHFDLFGLRQVWLHLLGRSYTPVPFRMRSYYRFIRHPLMLGWLIGFWATPHMTFGHLAFAVLNAAYILVGIYFEERSLVAEHGEAYTEYRNSVSMLLPIPKNGGAPAAGQRVA